MSVAIRVGWIIVAVILACLRLGGEKGELFQAIAHIIVGGLFGAAILGLTIYLKFRTILGLVGPSLRSATIFCFVIAFAVSLVEVFAFLRGVINP